MRLDGSHFWLDLMMLRFLHRRPILIIIILVYVPLTSTDSKVLIKFGFVRRMPVPNNNCEERE